ELIRNDAERGGDIRWRRPASVADAEAAIAEALATGKPAFLDFTGPSCVNCQKMEKSVFRVASVIKALNSLAPIRVDTDPPHGDLAQWQQERFHSQNRPLYVRIAKGAAGGPEIEARWSEVFPPEDTATLARFQAFLDGGAGSDAGTGGSSGFWLLAVFGGLITLLMPCTYPMIPFTVNFFAKQAAGGKSLLPLALFYAVGIVACFVGLGVLITGVLHSSLSTVAGHPITNLVIAVMFVVLGFSLLGAFLLRLPGNLETKIGGGKSGYAGALIMGLTFAVTAFSCAAPFAGTVLAEAVASGRWIRAVEGMAVYGGTIAVPFFLLAMSPGILRAMPRAGSWMNEFKVVGGLVEIAAALKFLAICDYAWGWGVIGRTFTIASWSACALVIAIYLLGLIRWSGDSKVEAVGIGRLMSSLAFLMLAVWLGSGLCGHNLGTFESFFPGDPAP
nr:thioredoxin family protein [Planctomycetota bacterium]